MNYTAQQSTSAPSIAQALGLGNERIDSRKNSHESDDNGVSFSDIVREEQRVREAQEAAEARDARNKENAEKSLEKKEAAAEQLAKDEDKKAAAANSNDKSAASDEDSNRDAEAGENKQSSVNSEALFSNAVLDSTKLSPAVQGFLKSLTLESGANTQSLSIDMSAFAKLSGAEKQEALSFLTSMDMQDIYGLYSGSENPIASIEEFFGRLKQQYAQNDPAAMLNNLTPQQVTAIENYLAQNQSVKGSARDMINAILALQNIDPDTALSRGGPNGAYAGMEKSQIINQTLNNATADDIAAILKDLTQIIKPQAQQTALKGAASTAAGQADAQAATSAEQQLAARLNNLMTGAGTKADANMLNGGTNASNPFANADGETMDAAFQRLINQYTGGQQAQQGYTPAQGSNGANNAAAQAGANAAQNSAAVAPNPLMPITDMGGQAGVLSVADSILQELGLTGTMVNGNGAQAAGLTNITTGSQTAGQAHPATHNVAATLHKAAANGANKAITLRLDPPELGRVEIKMSFEQNSKIKAVLTAERPETHLMMQRDQQVLERALQDAGFDTEGALEFELAQDGHDFGQDGSHEQFHQGKSGNQYAEDEVETIETVMNWSVDSNTGYVSYDLLA